MVKKIDVFGISDIVIRILFNSTEEELTRLNITKGTRTLINLTRRNELLSSLSGKEEKVNVEGYAVTAMKAMSYLGLKTAVAGKIGLDSFGIDVASQLENVNLDLDLKMGYGCTDSKIFFKTPDNIMTRHYHRGMSKNMNFNEIDSVKIKHARNLFITGNLIDNIGRIRIAKFVTRIAKESDTKIIFDVNNVKNIVNNRKSIIEFMKMTDVNIISLDEAYMLFETNKPQEILAKLSEFAPINVLKQKDKYFVVDSGNQYSVTRNPGQSRFADQFFAAGFLFGYNQEYGIDKAVIIGSYMASKQEIGNSILEELHEIM